MRSDLTLGALAGAAVAISIAVALRQMNVIRRLPDVPWRGFDADRVTTSAQAHLLGIPDAIPATALYLTELALRACVAGGAIAAGYYLYKMIAVERRACVYCLAAISLNFAMVPVAIRVLDDR